MFVGDGALGRAYHEALPKTASMTNKDTKESSLHNHVKILQKSVICKLNEPSVETKPTNTFVLGGPASSLGNKQCLTKQFSPAKEVTQMKQVVGAEDRNRREKIWIIKRKAVQTKKERDMASRGLITMMTLTSDFLLACLLSPPLVQIWRLNSVGLLCIWRLNNSSTNED